MTTHIRASIGWQVDSLLPRDAVTINPTFRYNPILIPGDPAWQTLADDLAAAVNSWSVAPSARQLTVKLYEIKDPVPGTPNRPKATKTLATGLFATNNWPGEVACCLSFASGAGGPHQRGRLYVPAMACCSTAPAGRPSSTERTKVGALAPIFANLGGVNVDWVIWSRTQKSAAQVDRWFVDDEWDTVRSRGLKPTTRTTGTTSG